MDEFAYAVDQACKFLLQHAEVRSSSRHQYRSLMILGFQEEENIHYKQLSAKLSDAEKSSLAVEFLKAREMAPSRPHPRAPQTGGVAQKLMGGMGECIYASHKL